MAEVNHEVFFGVTGPPHGSNGGTRIENLENTVIVSRNYEICCGNCGSSNIITHLAHVEQHVNWPNNLNTMPPDPPRVEMDDYGPITSRTRWLLSNHEVELQEED